MKINLKNCKWSLRQKQKNPVYFANKLYDIIDI